MNDPIDIGNLVLAIGALGAASFALVDATKIGWHGGISNSGFGFIKACVNKLLPADRRGELLDILHSHWINGTKLVDQKAIAKSLLKLKLLKETAGHFAAATHVDPEMLTQVANCMQEGTALNEKQSNTLGRFDLYLTALIDAAYQKADQRYRNSAKLLASIIAIVLSICGGWAVSEDADKPFFWTSFMAISVLCGLLATPLAPISKDLTSALQAGVKVAQAIRK